MYFVSNGSTEKWYASNANNTTQTTTDITSSIALDEDYMRVSIAKSLTDIKYYVDGVLVATHTTNLPTGNNSGGGGALVVGGGNTGIQLGTANIIYLASAEHKLKMF